MKIAFCVLAHQYPESLKRLIRSLDDSRFDFFVHVDKKAKIEEFEFETYNLQYSKLEVIPNRIKAYWGDISLFNVMLETYRYALSMGGL